MSEAEADRPLVVAIPSKGRLQENAAAFFARAGLAMAQARGARDYRGVLEGVPDAEVVYLSASEIAQQLASGGVHLGVTGEDLLRETISNAGETVELLTGLGFGFANVVVAVPHAWIDVRTMRDLDEVAGELRVRHGRRLRVATKYASLTRRFFAESGLADYRIVESLGATEGAPAAGSADVVVDITTTGATLKANGLKVLDDGVLLRSEASLVAALRAPWGARARAAVRTVLGRIAAEEEARTTREVRAGLGASTNEVEALARRFEASVPFGRDSGREIVLHCGQARVFALVDSLIEQGARDVTVRALDYVFRARTPLSDRLLARLDGTAARDPREAVAPA